MKKKLIGIVSLLTLFSAFMVSAQETGGQSLRGLIEANLLNQLLSYPQEKVYLHVDRDYYVPGDRIWFKAYLVHAATHRRFDGSRYVYVDLVSPADTIVSRTLLRPDANGLHHGNLYLAEVVPEGDYTLRAYTKYMINPEEDYIFKKKIHIGNLSSAPQEKNRNTRQRNARQPKEDWQVSFFPEGGNLLEGVFCHVAFKALNSQGHSEYIMGEVVDENDEVITTFRTMHAGMGGFGLFPEAGKKYTAICYNSRGESKRFVLPETQKDGYALTTSYWRGQKLMVGRLKSSHQGEFGKMYLFAHSRGVPLHFGEWSQEKECIVFTEDQLPSGVVQFLLFDKDMNVVSERLVFSKSKDQGLVELVTEKEQFKAREHVTVDLNFTTPEGRPLTGDLSVSVTDDSDLPPDNSMTLFSTLLLSSELKGYIEDPGYYFERDNDTTMLALDYLMMTQGWRRYDIPEVMKGNYTSATTPFEKSLEITGRVKSLWTSKGVENGEVALFTLNTRELEHATTNKDGRFAFENIEFPDSTGFYVTATNMKGGERVELIMDEFKPAAKAIKKSEAREIDMEAVTALSAEREREREAQKMAMRFMEKAGERYKYDEDMRIIYLPEVEVVAKKPEDKAWSIYSAFADRSLTYETIVERNPISTFDLLTSIAGLKVFSIIGESGNYITSVSFVGSEVTPAIMVDDVFIDPSEEDPFSSIPVSFIERIDVFRGAGASLFGVRGAGGVISITTLKGPKGSGEDPIKFNQRTFSPLGYQRPVEFYSPQYETEDQRFSVNPDLRTTIYWKPDIITTPEGKATFDFYASDFSTNYSIVIEGLSEEGKVVREVQRIRVE